MATRQRPPRGRLRLSPTPPLEHGGNNEPPREMATTSRPEQNPRLAGRERKTTISRNTIDMDNIETITRHRDLALDASPGRDVTVPQIRAPGIRTLIFERSPESMTSLDPATPEFIPGIPYRQNFQEAAPESRVRSHTSYARYLYARPLNFGNISVPSEQHDREPAVSTSSIAAGHAQEGQGRDNKI